MILLADVIGRVDVQSQQLGDIHLGTVLDDAGQTPGQSHVLVEQLEGVGQGQEGADGTGRHDVGDGHMPQSLPAGGTVDLGSKKIILKGAPSFIIVTA